MIRLKASRRALLAYLWILVPMYAVERLANYLFLSHDPTFYLISGWRLEIFILSCLIGSISAGAYIRNYVLASGAGIGALATILAAVNLACDPRVCYSSSPDGLEQLRIAYFLMSVVLSGAWIGASSGGTDQVRTWEKVLAAGAVFAAIAWYPTIFTFAGTGLLSRFSPWGVLAVFFVLSLSTALGATEYLLRPAAILVPVAAMLLTFAISAGIAGQYLDSLIPPIALMVASTIAGAIIGVVMRTIQGLLKFRRAIVRDGLAASVFLVLLMTLVIIPDAVVGYAPVGQNGAGYSIGTPVYAGAFMDAPQGHALGAGVNVSFAGTDPGTIPVNEFLGAGIGIHGAGCCVDGIDYAYRFDAYLLHGGKISLLAAGWEACDNNVACGGHSWKLLLFSKTLDIGTGLGPVALRMQWGGGRIQWSYSLQGSSFVNMTAFEPPAAENRNFNTGISGGVSLSSQKEAYFYQFGVTSGVPLEQPWKVYFQCPSLYSVSGWACIDHAGALRGYDSYWKVIWRWGEDYLGVRITTVGKDSAIFEYSPSNDTADLTPLW